MISLIDEGMGSSKTQNLILSNCGTPCRLCAWLGMPGDWSYTVDLYNYLLPKVSREEKKHHFTTGLCGHWRYAKVGKYPEAALA
ncbi:MAG: hypothetical protein R2778_02855 [Saprospiraceae bacterium]